MPGNPDKSGKHSKERNQNGTKGGDYSKDRESRPYQNRSNEQTGSNPKHDRDYERCANGQENHEHHPRERELDSVNRPEDNSFQDDVGRYHRSMRGISLGPSSLQDTSEIGSGETKEGGETGRLQGTLSELNQIGKGSEKHPRPGDNQHLQQEAQQGQNETSKPRGPRSQAPDVSQHPQAQHQQQSPREHKSSERNVSHAPLYAQTHVEIYESDIQSQKSHPQQENVLLPLVEWHKLTHDREVYRRLFKAQEQELEQEKAKREKIEKAALELTDRFQPAFDPELKAHYNTLDAKVTMVAKSMHDLIPSRKEPDQWPQGVRWESFIRPVKFSDKTSRRAILTGVVWKFLVDNIFNQRFSCFGGELAQKVNEIHNALFANNHGLIEETEDSAKWRASTAKYLEPTFSSTHSILQRQLEDILVKEIGYENIAKPRGKIKAMLEAAESFKRLLMRQRAVFDMFIPTPRHGYSKAEGDRYLDNDSEEDDKSAGQIWFVIKPGLIKRGTGRGTHFDEQTVIMPALVRLK